MEDPRFNHISTDPRFQGVPRKRRKVTVDTRFKSMFDSERFKVNYKVDKRGRHVQQSSSDNLKKYYQLSNLPDSQEGDDQDIHEEDENEDEDEDEDSDTSTDIDEDNLNDLQTSEYFSQWLDQSAAVPQSETVSSRLAVCNMNWDRITSIDLYVLFNSFRPKNGVIESVTIYPSDFGLERMKQEDQSGPAELIEELPIDEGDNPGHIEGRDFTHDKLREYQLNRLKYYYAVIKCDSTATAEHIYNECDGLEYELSSSTLDLRFVPDDVTFEDREPLSTATESSLTKDYKPSEFFTTALQQSTVQLTWDETHPSRLQTTMKKYNKEELTNVNFNNFIASSSDEETQDRDQYRSLLGLDGSENREKEEEQGEELEITWNIGLKDQVRKSKDGEVEDMKDGFDDPFFTDQNEKKRKKKKKVKQSKEEIEKSQKEKEELELLVMSDSEERKEHFSIDQILSEEKKESAKKKRKRRKEHERETKLSSDVTEFEIDLDDPRFSALYNRHDYAIEPSHHQYKETKAMKSLLTERQRRRKLDNDTVVPLDYGSNLRALVKSVKSKTANLKKPKS